MTYLELKYILFNLYKKDLLLLSDIQNSISMYIVFSPIISEANRAIQSFEVYHR